MSYFRKDSNSLFELGEGGLVLVAGVHQVSRGVRLKEISDTEKAVWGGEYPEKPFVC